MTAACATTECADTLASLAEGSCVVYGSSGEPLALPADGFLISVPQLAGVNLREYGIIGDLYCDARCSTLEYASQCEDVVLGTCSVECAATVIAVRALGPDGSDECTAMWQSVYETHRPVGLWLDAMEETFQICTGGVEVPVASDPTVISCQTAIQAADTVCDAAGVDKATESRCESVECVSAVNAVVLLHDECTTIDSASADVEVWPLVASAVADLEAVQCTCQDHSLAAYDGPGPPGRLSALSVLYSKSVLCGAFVWARRVLNSQKRRFPARAGLTDQTCSDLTALGVCHREKETGGSGGSIEPLGLFLRTPIPFTWRILSAFLPT
jgi:hypothetical protein